MKAITRILSALFVVAFVFALSACGKTGSGAQHTTTTRSAQTQKAEEAEAQAPEDKQTTAVSSLDLYKDTIANYGKARTGAAASLGYDIDMPEYEYAIRDVNGDGTDELVIHEKGENAEGTIGAIYTLDGERPVELYFIGRHGSYSITSTGYFVYTYHNIVLEKLVGTKLVQVAESAPLDGEYDDEETEAFFRANGIANDNMRFKYIPYK